MKNIEKNLYESLIFDEVEFTIYDNFPFASVKINNLLLKESQNFDNDTLLYTERAYVELSLIDIFNKNYDIKNIIVTDATVNFKYNDLNESNFQIFRKNDSENDVSIKKITILNSKLKIQKSLTKLDLSWFINRAIIDIDATNYKFITDCFSKKLVVGKTDYLNQKKINFDCTTNITKGIIAIKSSLINIESVIFNMNGTVISGNLLDLNIEAKNQSIDSLVSHLPLKMKKICAPFILDGDISLSGSLKGLMNKENNPQFKMDYKISEGSYKLKSIPFILNNINMEGVVNNGLKRNFETTKIVADIFNAKTKKGFINGNFTVKNLNDYFLKSSFRSAWDLSEVSTYFEDSPFIGLEGKLFTTTKYIGNISFDKTFKKKFLSAKHTSDVTFKEAFFNYNTFPLRFNFKSLKGKLENEKISIKSSITNISKSDISFKGDIYNLIAFILNSASKIYINGDLISNNINLLELMTLNDLSTNNKIKTILPNWIDVNTSVNVKKLKFKSFESSNLTSKISFNNNILQLDSLETDLLNGNLKGDFYITEPLAENLKLSSNFIVEKINIRKSFDTFDNYGQTFIKKENLVGIGSAELDITAHWKPNFVLDAKKLKVKSHLVIEKGELIDFKPLESLSSYVSIEELKHVTFSTLENTIDISNEIINIPTMEIKSSALSLLISGTHSFKQEINYEVTLLLSELISDSFRKKNTQITSFGEEKKDGKIFNTIYFKMTGNTDNPKISLNKIRFMEDLTKSLNKEKETISEIINNDILKKEEVEVKEVGQEIEIKWDPKF